MLSLQDIESAYHRISQIITPTPLVYDRVLSQRHGAHIYLKREDLQIVRSYKIRGAYNKIASLSSDDRKKGVICASAGNHAQGVAYCCQHLKIRGRIFMPATTPKQKVRQVRMFGGDFVEVVLSGDTYDDANRYAQAACLESESLFIHPFDDELVMAGQGTVGLEIMNQADFKVDYVIAPIGGGGLVSGMGFYLKSTHPDICLLGVEPQGAPSMRLSIERGERVQLNDIEKFVDGAAVALVGEKNFEIAKDVLDDIVLVPEGHVCSTILQLYNEEAIVVEPAGALSVAALDFVADEIRGKRVVCIVSGGNNDITRTEEIKERSLLYQGLKHYFIIRFPQRSGALRDFLNSVLGPDDDITHFEYTKKNSREKGPALVGIEIRHKEDYESLLVRMKAYGIAYESVNDSPDLFHLLI